MDLQNVHMILEIAENYTEEKYIEEIISFARLSADFQEEEWDFLWDELQKVTNDRARLVFGMECLNAVPDNGKYEAQLELLYQTDALDWSEKYYLWGQIGSQLFTSSQINSEKISELRFAIYHQISQTFLAQLPPMKKIENRNEQLVLVTVQQFLTLTHGPTKTTLDRAEVLKKHMGKQVVIINTAEMGGGKLVGLLHRTCPNYMSERCEDTSLEYNGDIYPYMQFDQNMPNIENTMELIEFIQKYKPAYIVNIGGSSLAVDACSQLVPTININTVPSGITSIETTMQVIGRKLQEQDEHLLKMLGKTAEDVIVGRFTWSLKKQSITYTREELGIGKDLFLIAVIGGRLTKELDDEFRKMIDEILMQGAVLVIIGKYEQYEEVCQIDPVFASHTLNLGVQSDVLAILDFCDLYVNPKRTGGGTSVIEAMYKCLPAVTLNYGDVALGAGEEFCVDNYEEMKKQILRYMSDKEYYRLMSDKAKKRADYMLDSTGAFMDIMQQFQQRIDGEV